MFGKPFNSAARRLDYECLRESMLGSDFTQSTNVKRGHSYSNDHSNDCIISESTNGYFLYVEHV